MFNGALNTPETEIKNSSFRQTILYPGKHHKPIYHTYTDHEKKEHANKHAEKLRVCSTEWLTFLIVDLETGKSEYRTIQNYCKQRDCPVCLAHRIGLAKTQLKPYFKLMKKVVHVTLTFGKHMDLTRDNTRYCRRKLSALEKRLSRGKFKYRGISVLEFKPKDNEGHFHYHVAFDGFSPHHLSLMRAWSDILGKNTRIHVNYKAKRNAVMCYFAKRSAYAGENLNPLQYLTLVHNTRIFNTFGKWPKKSFILVYMENISDINGLNSLKKSRKYAIFLVLRMSKSQNTTIPPPELTDITYLDQIWADKC